MANMFNQGVWQLAHYPNDAKPCTMVFNTITDAVDSVWYEDEHDAEWAAFVAAVEKWSAAAKSAGAIAYVGTTAAHYSDAILDAAKNQLAEEVSEYLGPSTT